MTLSTRAKEAIKTALAMTIAYGIGLQAGWDRPYWAGFAIAFISLASVGQSLNKGALRMVGTAVGAIVALTLISLFAQQRWLFILFLSLWFGLCTYMNSGSRYQYFWFVAAFVSLIIAADGGPYPESAFATAMLRLQQTGLGIAVYTLVTVLLWPINSRKDLESTTLTLNAKQRALFQASLALLMARGDNKDVQALRTDEIAGNTRLAVLLDAAVTDSDEVREAPQLWRDYQSSVAELGESMQRWRENFPVLQSLELTRLLPGLDAFGTELDERFNAIEKLLENKPAAFQCKSVNLAPDPGAIDALSHFHRAALLVTEHQLVHLDTLTRNLFDTVSAIRGSANSSISCKPAKGRPAPFTLDPDRLLASAKMMLALWLAFLAVFYIGDFPGGMGFTSMCGPIGLILFNNPQMRVTALVKPVATGILFAAALYIFVMPELSSFAGLGLMIFAATFVLCYRYAAPEQALGRTFGLAMFVTLISVSNQQSYNFLSVANTALMFPLLFLLLAIVAYIPFSAMPERALMRLLKRYFHSAAFLLTQDAKVSGAASRRKVFHQQQLAFLPAKMQAWAAHVSPTVLGAESAEKLPRLIDSLQALTYRMQALQDARSLPQPTLLAGALTGDMLQWRQKVLELLQRLAQDPACGQATGRTRLDRLLAQMEARIAMTIDSATTNSVNTGEMENFYRILGAYRGASAALLDFTELAATIEWSPWYEERFA